MTSLNSSNNIIFIVVFLWYNVEVVLCKGERSMRDIYAVLDIGSSTIKLVVGEVVNGLICVLYAKKIASQGVKKGIIENRNRVIEDVKSLLDDASKMLNATIERVALCIPSNYTRLYKSEGTVSVDSFEIKREDVVEVLKKSKNFNRDENEEIITVMPIKYYLDNKVTDELPIGEISSSLKVESLIITTRKSLLYSYIGVVEKAGAQVLEITIDVYACAKEAFNSVYLQEGVVLLDIGHEESTVSFFEEGYLKFISSIKSGGVDVTKKISSNWLIPLEKAEKYKMRYGTCECEDDDLIHMTKKGDKIINYTQRDLSFLVNESVEELMMQVKNKIELINNGRAYETIIVGGGAELPLIENVSSNVLGTSVRVYRPDTVGARDTQYVSCLGMIYYLNDRTKIIGGYEPSIVMSDISNTMSYRLKGLTVVKDNENVKKKRISKVLDSIFGEDKE